MTTSVSPAPYGATAIITHRVNPGQQGAYEDWLLRIGVACSSQSGHLDTQIVRPIADLTDTYTVIVRFDDQHCLQQWMHSATRQQLIAEVQPLLAEADRFHVRSGLDYWFLPESVQARMPKRWKQALATWTVLYPLVLGVPLVLLPALQYLGMPAWHWLQTLATTAVIVCLMVYVVMPRWTRLLAKWLFG
jgi:antibiotic biosynthesis monooxygenase (ABM) superfamily enzyme